MRPATDLQALMQAAVGHHRGGRLQEAVALYERVLAEAPDQPDALHLLGLALNRLGHPAEALVSVQRAVELQPEHPGFQFSLGNLLLAAGRAAEAEPALRKALAADPQDAGARNALAVALLRSGRTAEAVRELREVLAREPDHVPTLDNLAAALLKAKGRDAATEAERLARRALELAPGGGASLNNLGGALLQLERTEEAERELLKAVQARPDFAEAWFNLGLAALRLHKLLAADGALRRAVKLSPDEVAYLLAASNVAANLSLHEEALMLASRAHALDPEAPEVMAALASAWRDQGDFTEAERLLRAAIARSPSSFLNGVLGHLLWEAGDLDAARVVLEAALAADPSNLQARHSLVQSGRVASLDDPNVREILRLAERTDLREEDRISLGYSLGKAHDDVGDHATAFRWYREANELKKHTTTPYDPAQERVYVERNRKLFTRERVAELQRHGSRSELPVFVVGLPRSGTSLAEQIIASHPAAHGAGELIKIREVSARISAAVADRGGPEYPDAVLALRPEEVGAFADLYLEHLKRGVAPGVQRIVDKMPLNLKHLGLIATLFPKARVVHCTRHPVDNCVSIYFQHFGRGNNFANDLVDLGDLYGNCARLMAHWKAELPIEILDLPYEGVVEDPERWARRLIDHIGLPWDPACLEFHKTERAVRTASAWQVKQPIYKRSVARWKRYGDALQPLIDELRAQGVDVG